MSFSSTPFRPWVSCRIATHNFAHELNLKIERTLCLIIHAPLDHEQMTGKNHAQRILFLLITQNEAQSGHVIIKAFDIIGPKQSSQAD